jgi:hypothetical protein
MSAMRPILLRDASVVTMHPALGELSRGAVLIEGDRIAAVAPDIVAGDAETIDARGFIVTPQGWNVLEAEGLVGDNVQCRARQRSLRRPAAPLRRSRRQLRRDGGKRNEPGPRPPHHAGLSHMSKEIIPEFFVPRR